MRIFANFKLLIFFYNTKYGILGMEILICVLNSALELGNAVGIVVW